MTRIYPCTLWRGREASPVIDVHATTAVTLHELRTNRGTRAETIEVREGARKATT